MAVAKDGVEPEVSTRKILVVDSESQSRRDLKAACEQDGYEVALRWSMVGTHRGYGVYGLPTGRRVHLWGITQDIVKGGIIQEEGMLFNEFHVLQQLLRDDPLTLP